LRAWFCKALKLASRDREGAVGSRILPSRYREGAVTLEQTMMRRRFSVALAGCTLAVSAAIFAQTMTVTQIKEEVRISAPDFHFLTGKPLERLRSGKAVAFDFQLSALSEGKSNVLQRSFERYVVSYDLWEQSYSVSRLRSKRGQAAHLSAAQAETWCLDGITLSSLTLPKNEPLWVRLEVRAQDGKTTDPLFEDTGLSLSGLVDVFSRASRTGRGDQWKIETGPIRLR
jgi:hypothetical protein